jgi:hypothetical protein
VARAAEESVADAREEQRRLNALVEELRSEKAAAAQRQEEARAAGEAKAEEAKSAAGAAEESLAATRKQLAEAEGSVARAIVEREELRQQVTTLEKALGEAEEERDEFHRESTRLENRLHALGVAQPPAGDAAAGGKGEPPPFSSESVEALRRALAVMRRTPFLPPPLRVAAQEAEAAAGARAEPKESWARVVILDRDTPALEPLAGIFRGWEKDRPGLALYVSFSRDSSPEVERAQRVPLSLTKGRFQRPLNWTDLMEMLQPLRHTTT